MMKTPGKRIKTELIDKDLLDKIIEEFGYEPQYNMLCEECAELTKAMLKYIRHAKFSKTDESEGDKTNIADEIADVSIMLSQVKQMLDLESQVEERIKFKIDRLITRLDEHDKIKGN